MDQTTYQHLILNQEGIILQSDENLFQIKDIHWDTAEDLISFYQSIFPNITGSLKHQKLITFKAVNAPATMLPGIYDFIFSLKPNVMKLSQPLIECWIIERTEFYKDVQQFRQYHNEGAITTIAA